MSQPQWPLFDAPQLESICRLLGDTAEGLTGPQIGGYLGQCGIIDTDPGITKWRRLFNALAASQNTKGNSTFILKFISTVMQPANYFSKSDQLNYRLNELNKRLSLVGLELSDEIKFRIVKKAQSLSEAELRASRFRFKLENRNIHEQVIKYSEKEIKDENYFHSVFEGVKGIGDRLRSMSNLHADGHALVETAFLISNPLVRINLLQTDTERSEHNGLANLIKGLFSHIRNPTAHVARIKFIIPEDEALDVLTIVSFIHKKLDKAL